MNEITLRAAMMNTGRHDMCIYHPVIRTIKQRKQNKTKRYEDIKEKHVADFRCRRRILRRCRMKGQITIRVAMINTQI